MRYLFLHIIFLFISSILFGQTPFFKKHKPLKDLNIGKVELIFEDNATLLWFGSQNGLMSYDGLEFTHYMRKDSITNHVRSIFQDKKGQMWVGYQDGKICFLKKGKLENWEPEEGLPTSPVVGFFEDQKGRIWFATYGEGLYVKDENRIYNFDQEDGLTGNDIYVLQKDTQQRIWVGTDGGISICSFEKKEKKIENLTRDDGLPDEIIHEIVSDKNGNFWIGTYDGGICFYDSKTQKLSTPIKNWTAGIINSIEIFEGRELWIGTEDNGLWTYSLTDSLLLSQSVNDEIPFSKIYDLHQDVEGNIWVANNNEGISQANRQFEFIQTNFENTQALWSDNENKIWIGTQKGLFTFERNTSGQSIFKNLITNQNVISLFEDKFENLWIGTFGKGVIVFNKKTKVIRKIDEEDGLTNGSILSIEGNEEHVWLATLGGVTRIDLSKNPISAENILLKNFTQENGLGTEYIYKVFCDSKNRIWFSTDGKGVTVLENGKFKNFRNHSNQNATQFKSVYSITEDHEGHIWISTAKEGVFKFDGSNFNSVREIPTTLNNSITGLITDQNGQILITHAFGISVLNPNNHEFINYGKSVGISEIDPYLNAFCSDQNGNIWFGVDNGIIKYLPLNEQLVKSPRTRITEVAVFMQPIDFQSNSTLKHNQSNLMFEYQGLWYTDPSAVKYRYQLEGYDQDWIITNDQNAIYSNLPPGKYTFKVSSTENGTWKEHQLASYTFTIAKPFWKTSWFALLALSLSVFCFYWFQKRRDQRLQRVNLLEKEKAQSQLEALKSQVNPHFLFNSFNTLSTIIDEDPKAAVEYVERMSDFYRSILQYRDKKVIPLQEEVRLIEDYNFLLKKRFGNNFNLQIQTNGEPIYIAPLTLQMLVENAVKHNVVSKSKPLEVVIDFDKNKEYVTVENNLQPKFTKEKSTNFGLQSIKKRYSLLSSRKVQVIESEETFKVKIPVIE